MNMKNIEQCKIKIMFYVSDFDKLLIETEKIGNHQKQYSKKKKFLLNDNKISEVDVIYRDIKEKVINARSKMLKQIDTTMIDVYWYVGKITSELYNNSSDETYGKE